MRNTPAEAGTPQKNVEDKAARLRFRRTPSAEDFALEVRARAPWDSQDHAPKSGHNLCKAVRNTRGQPHSRRLDKRPASPGRACQKKRRGSIPVRLGARRLRKRVTPGERDRASSIAPARP